MTWICKECGSNNEDSLTSCEVCGCSEKLGSVPSKVILTRAKASALPIVSGVVSISEPYNIVGAHAFEGNTEITTVIMHDNMLGIYKQAFKNCKNLKDVIFSGTLDNIGPEAFYNVELSSRPASRSVDSSAFAKDRPTSSGFTSSSTSRTSSSTSRSSSSTSRTSSSTSRTSSSTSRSSFGSAGSGSASSGSASVIPPSFISGSSSSSSGSSSSSYGSSSSSYGSSASSYSSYSSPSSSSRPYTSYSTPRTSSSTSRSSSSYSRPSSSSGYFSTRRSTLSSRTKKALKIIIPTVIYLVLVALAVGLGMTTLAFEAPQWISIMSILGMIGILGYSFIGYKNLNWCLYFTLFLAAAAFVNAIIGYIYIYYFLGAIVNGGVIGIGAMVYAVNLIKRGKKVGGVAAILISLISLLVGVIYGTYLEKLYNSGMNIIFTIVMVGLLGAFILLISDIPRSRAPAYGKHKTRIAQIAVASIALISIGCTWGLGRIEDKTLNLTIHAFLAFCGAIFTLIQHFSITYRDRQLKLYSAMFTGANILWILITKGVGGFRDPSAQMWAFSVILGVMVFYLIASANSLVSVYYTRYKHSFTTLALIPLAIVHIVLFYLYPFTSWKYMIGLSALSALYLIIHSQKILDDTAPDAENMIYVFAAFYVALTVLLPVGMTYGFKNIAMEGIMGSLIAMLAAVILWVLGEFWDISLVSEKYYPHLVGLSAFAITNIVLWSMGFYTIFACPIALVCLVFSIADIKMTAHDSFTVGMFWSIALSILNGLTFVLAVLSYLGVIGG